MPRDANGNMSLVAGNPVVTDTDIESVWANTTLTDISAEITNSLDRAGRGAMTAQLKAFAGTVGAPGWSWALELNAGWYRAAAGDFRFSIGGVDKLTIVSAGVSFPGTLSVTGVLSAAGTLELGHASDTTLSRISAGVLGVEGVALFKQGGTTLELGHASDTTLTRVSAGVFAVEGHAVPTVDEIKTITAAWVFSGSPQINAINLGHASDTTITRSVAGRIAVEGDEVVLEGDHNLDSGTYTPVATNGLRVTANTERVCRFIRIGSQVFVAGTIDITTSSAGAADFTLTLPIAMSSTTFQELAGVMTFVGSIRGAGRVQGEPTGEEATFQFTAPGAESIIVDFHFAYTI